MKHKLFALALLLLLPCSFAYDLRETITEQNHFLKEGETIEQPAIKITLGNRAYWVVPVLSADALVTFIPLLASAPEVSTSRITNRGLFEAADVLRGYLLNKRSISANPSVEWYVNNGNSRIAGNLANFLADEVYQLNSIAAELGSDDVSGQVDVMNPLLASLSSQCSALEAAMQDALAFEGKLTREISAEELYGLREIFGNAITATDSLDSDALRYRSELDKLKQLISLSDADIDTKSGLLALAQPPAEFEYIGRWAISADNLKSIIDSIYSTQAGRTDSLLDEFEKRLELSSAYSVMYGSDAELASLSSEFTSLATAASIVLNKENKPNWENQAALGRLEQEWRAAERAYARTDYKVAEEHAVRAKAELKNVYEKGFIEVESQPLLSQQILIQLVVLLVGLLVVAYLLKNRSRIKGLIALQQKEEEVKISGWEKR